MEIRQSRSLIREFKPWMIDALKSHIHQGYSARSFSGYYLIDNHLWGAWLKEVPELKSINEKYKLEVNLKRRAMVDWGNGLGKNREDSFKPDRD